jgi:hypothetical protein
MPVRSTDWLDLARREYLRRFVPGGGSAIKFVMGEDSELADIERALAQIADSERFRYIAVNAAATKVHMIHDVFFAVSRNIDWEQLAQKWVEDAFHHIQYSWPRPGSSLPLAEVAAVNNVDPMLLRKQFQERLTQQVLKDNRLAQDFRAAMGNLCMRRMELGDERATAPVIEWLRGELRAISPVKDVPINAKITRHNGRTMLRSLFHWLRICGESGLVLTIDIRQLARKSGTDIEGLRFGPAAVLDAYEVLRQLIDDCENFKGLFLTVLANPSFRDDPKRGVNAYDALKERIWADVHPRGHVNPLTPLVQIGNHLDADLPRVKGEPLEMPYNEERVALEALRAGVPNRAAIRMLGSSEGPLCQRFLEKLRQCRDGLKIESTVPGELVDGGFGAGKSHLLGYLAEQALKEKFIVSIVPISKETPFFDPQKVYAAAIRNAVVPERNDDVMTAALYRLDGRSSAFAELEEWASSEASGLSPLFAALLYLVPRQVTTTEDLATIARFLGGAKLGVAKVKQWLRAAGAARLFSIGPVRAGDLAMQRLRFAPRLFAAAGYSGWCILIDELELIGRYSTLQRARSYAELCRWLNLDDAVSVSGLVSVAAITDDFADQVLHRRLDQERVPAFLRDKGLEQHLRLAEIGMAHIEQNSTHLSPPDDERLHRSLDTVRRLYGESHGWPAYGGEIGERTVGRTMRGYIKAWITQWDIERLFGESDVIETEQYASNYTENKELERAPVDETSEEEVG